MLSDLAHGSPRHPRPSNLWWAYFALLVALSVVFTLSAIASPDFSGSFAASLFTAASLVFDIICIAGLYAYIRSMPLFTAAFWRVILTLVIAKVFVSASFFVPNLFPWESAPEQYVALIGLLSLAISVPLMLALWRYSFKSSHIWNPTVSAFASDGP